MGFNVKSFALSNYFEQRTIFIKTAKKTLRKIVRKLNLINYEVKMTLEGNESKQSRLSFHAIPR